MKEYYLQAESINGPIFVAERPLAMTIKVGALNFTSFSSYARRYDERDLPRQGPKKFFKVLAKEYLNRECEFAFIEIPTKEKS